MAARKRSLPPKELTDSIPVEPSHNHSPQGVPADGCPACDALCEQGETIIAATKPQFKDFAPIQVPITAVRMELAALSKDGLDFMPLSEFLLMVHRVIIEQSIVELAELVTDITNPHPYGDKND
jgi:hypothetical protein